jgi:hypothetical protein
MQPINLSDSQMNAVFAATHPLPPESRSALLETCARERARLPEIGDGVVHRVVMRVPKAYFDPPNVRSENGRNYA